MYVCVFIYICMYVYIFIYIYIYARLLRTLPKVALEPKVECCGVLSTSPPGQHSGCQG